MSSATTRKELTLRGVIIGVVITVVFTAANVFFGLKAGLTFATSIPAAVISMAVLRYFKGATMQENNIVQTVASAAGTLSSIIFVLPGLIMIGWWTGFHYWTSFAICALGGILGVMYSIPLRRALVTNSDLPYPEGVACAEVLKVGPALAKAATPSGDRIQPRRAARRAVGLDRFGGVRGGRRDARVRRRCGALLPRPRRRRWRDRIRLLPVVRAVRHRPSGRLVGRRRDAGRRADRLGLGRAAFLRAGCR